MQNLEDEGELPRQFGPFMLVKLIARGGFGEVYLALRAIPGEPTDEICVVKRVRRELRGDSEIVGRFLDECRVMQMLNHPALCATLDAGVVGSQGFLALEFVSGRTLRDVETRVHTMGRALSPAIVLHVMGAVLSALDHAHTLLEPGTGRPMPVIHRDVSPHNILIGFDGGVKLIDFGLSLHRLRSEVTRSDMVVGKVRYSAPEYLREQPVDARSDVFAAGVILYELLAAARFYDGMSDEEIWRAAFANKFQPAHMDRLSPALRPVVEQAVAFDPAKRFPSAAALLQAMRDADLGGATAPKALTSLGAANAQALIARIMATTFRSELEEERASLSHALELAQSRTQIFTPPAVSDPTSVIEYQAGLRRGMATSPTVIRERLTSLVALSDEGAAALEEVRASFGDGVVSNPNSGVFKGPNVWPVPDLDVTDGVTPNGPPPAAVQAAQATAHAGQAARGNAPRPLRATYFDAETDPDRGPPPQRTQRPEAPPAHPSARAASLPSSQRAASGAEPRGAPVAEETRLSALADFGPTAAVIPTDLPIPVTTSSAPAIAPAMVPTGDKAVLAAVTSDPRNRTERTGPGSDVPPVDAAITEPHPRAGAKTVTLLAVALTVSLIIILVLLALLLAREFPRRTAPARAAHAGWLDPAPAEDNRG